MSVSDLSGCVMGSGVAVMFIVCVINYSLILKLVQDIGAYVPENVHAYFMRDILFLTLSPVAT